MRRLLSISSKYTLTTAAAILLITGLLGWIVFNLWRGASPSSSHPGGSLPYFLEHADNITIFFDDGGVGVDLAFLGPSSNAGMLHLLRQSANFHTKPPKRRGTIYFEALSIGGRVYVPEDAALQPYEYIPETGELGLGKEWCNVPNRFRIWINDLYKHAPKNRHRISHFPGVVVVSSAQARTRPICLVQSWRARLHVLKTEARESSDTAERLRPQDAVRSEVQYSVGNQYRDASPRWRRLATFTTRRDQRWPASYVGKTIYYRFRWKYRDGTTGPWSMPVSAKVLP